MIDINEAAWRALAIIFREYPEHGELILKALEKACRELNKDG